jgi:Glutamate dehydrogenase/leucine dehydrogenase
MSVADMIEVARTTKFVAGLPNSAGDVGGDPGPHTSLGVFLGIKAAVKHALGKDSLSGLHIAMQGAGSVATGVALHAYSEGANLTIADVDEAKARKLAAAAGGTLVSPDGILGVEADVVSPNALGAIMTEQSIAALKTPIVAGGANNQLATAEDGRRLHDAASSMRRIMSSMPAGSSMSARNIWRTVTRAWSVGASRAFRRGSSKSGRRAGQAAATRRRLPTLWRSA